MENASAVTLEFVLGTDVDIMIHEVREKINTIIEDFPSGVETPTLSKVNVNAIPVVTIFLTGTHSIDELYDYADETLAKQFSSIPGVGEVRFRIIKRCIQTFIVCFFAKQFDICFRNIPCCIRRPDDPGTAVLIPAGVFFFLISCLLRKAGSRQ